MRHRRSLKRLAAHNSRRAPKHRLMVRKTLKHVYAILIDDREGKVITAFSSKSPSVLKEYKPAEDGTGRRQATAKLVGGEAARYALNNGISEVVFDRGGYAYQGIVKQMAESARAAGLKF